MEVVIIFYVKNFSRYWENLLRRPGGRALAESQSLIVLSHDADAICFPSGENATARIPPE